VFLAACATTTFTTPSSDRTPPQAEVHTETEKNVTVSTAILSDAEAEAIYGVDLFGVGLQAIWLRIENATDHSHWLMVSALDPNYFSPDEAAVLLGATFSADDKQRLTMHMRSLAVPLHTEAGTVSEGYVLAPHREGGRYLEIVLSGDRHELHFGFAVPLPDGDFDFEKLHPANIYGDLERPDLTLDALRAALWELACCTTDADQQRNGDPLNMVLIGNADDVLASLARGGWSFTHRLGLKTVKRLISAALTGSAYPTAPISPLYFMGRPQDLGLQRSRNTILQRNHLRLWLAPYKFEGKSVWIGQISRDISIKGSMSSLGFVTHVIDPNVDEAREHLLQSLLVAGTVESFGFVGGMQPATLAEPRFNLAGDPYYTDGLRLVAELTGTTTVPVAKVEFLDWQRSPDPIATSRTVASEDETNPSKQDIPDDGS